MSTIDVIQGTLKFAQNNRLIFYGNEPGFTIGSCNGCRCCGNEVVGYTRCKFNRNSYIANYLFLYYAPGYLQQKWTGTDIFRKAPIGGGARDQVENLPPSSGEFGGSCCFCQEYEQIIYASDGSVIDVNYNIGGGRSIGFCYVPDRGWWDGNEATGGPYDGVTQVKGGIPCNGPASPTLGCQDGTFFFCGKCCGHISTSYKYSTGAFAIVSFDVVNYDCCDVDEYNESLFASDFDTQINSGGFLLDRGASLTDTQTHSIGGALFISGSRSSKITAPANNYSDKTIYCHYPSTLRFWVYRTNTSSEEVSLTVNGVEVYNSTDAGLPATTWTEVSVPLSAGNNTLVFTVPHDAAHAATDGIYLDDITITSG